MNSTDLKVNKIKSQLSDMPTLKNKFIIIGDSITFQNGSCDYIFEDSIAPPSSLIYSRGYFTQANILLRQRMKLVGKYGYSGQRTDYIIANMSTILATNPKPNYVIVHIGTNDIIQSKTFTEITTNLQNIYTQLKNAGIKVIACTIVPCNTSTTPQKLVHYQVNNWIVNYAYANNMFLCDWYTAICNVAGDTYNANMSNDGIHPETPACMLMGKVLFDLLDTILPKYDLLPKSNTDPDNLLLNGLFAVDTNADGLADSWAKYTPSGVYTQSIINRTDGTSGKWQGLTSDGTSTVNISQSTTNFNIGDNLCGVIEFELDLAITSVDCYYLNIACRLGSTSLQISNANKIGSSVTIRFDGTVKKGVLKVPCFTIPPTTDNVLFTFEGKWNGLLKVSKAKLWKVV